MDKFGYQATLSLATDEAAQETESYMDTMAGDLAAMVDDHFRLAKDGRITKEKEWLEDLRAWKGVYSPEVLDRIPEGQSRIFVKLTRSWCGSARSLILNILGMEGGYPWSIAPTPIPDLEHLDVELLQEAVQEAASMLPPEEAARFIQENNYELMLQAEKRQAELAGHKMRLEIEDQLAEGQWEQTFMRGLLPYVIYGTQVFQGPLSTIKRPKRWVKDVSGRWSLALKRQAEMEGDPFGVRPEVKALDIWSVYPDPVATKREECEFIIVRHVMNRHEMRGLMRQPGFDPDSIEDILLSHAATGDWVAEPWESSVEATVGQDPSTKRSDRFVVKEWWGHLSGQMLRANGVSVPDSMLMQECVACLWVCCGKVIKASVSNMEPASLPFFFVPYEDVPGSIWGQGVPRQMDDSQHLYNACERAKVNNMGISSGPQVVVDQSRVGDKVSANRQYPWKVWFVSNMDGLTQAPVSFFQPSSNIPHMQAMQTDVRQHLQKETSIPDFIASGVPGNLAHNRTAEGLSMAQNAALAFIRTVIGNIDTYLTAPMIEAYYHWNMAFNPKHDIKGDFEVVAKGVSGAMTREVASQRLNQLLIAAGNPEIKPWIKVDKAVQLWAKVMGYEDQDLTYSPKEVATQRQRDLEMQSQVEGQTRRVQPVMPRENAIMQLLLHTPETSPMYGPLYQEAAQTWGLMNPRLAAALNAWNQGNADRTQPLITPQDAMALGEDLAAEDFNAPAMPSARPLLPQRGGLAQPLPAGPLAGMGAAGGFHFGQP